MSINTCVRVYTFVYTLPGEQVRYSNVVIISAGPTFYVFIFFPSSHRKPPIDIPFRPTGNR